MSGTDEPIRLAGRTVGKVEDTAAVRGQRDTTNCMSFAFMHGLYVEVVAKASAEAKEQVGKTGERPGVEQKSEIGALVDLFNSQKRSQFIKDAGVLGIDTPQQVWEELLQKRAVQDQIRDYIQQCIDTKTTVDPSRIVDILGTAQYEVSRETVLEQIRSVIHDLGKHAGFSYGEFVAGPTEEKAEEKDGNGNAVGAAVSITRGVVPEASVIARKAMVAAIDENGNLSQEQKQQAKIDMFRESLNWGFTLGEVTEALKDIGATNSEAGGELIKQMQIDCTKRVVDLLRKLEEEEKEKEKERIRKELCALALLTPETMRAMEKNLQDGKTPDEVADALENHNRVVVAFHLGAIPMRIG